MEWLLPFYLGGLVASFCVLIFHDGVVDGLWQAIIWPIIVTFLIVSIVGALVMLTIRGIISNFTRS